jgi:hypothetical protein
VVSSKVITPSGKKDIYMKNQYDAVHSYILDRLDDGVGKDSWSSDLHHHLCNEDYFIIGTFKAKEFLGTESFDIIQKVKEYEQSNFGECNTDLSDPEKVANMFAYIAGEEILGESEALRDAWDRKLTDEDFEQIKLELASVNVNEVYYTCANGFC